MSAPGPASDAVVLGLDVGGTKLAGGLVSPSGELVRDLEVPTPVADGREGVLAALDGLGRRLLDEADRLGLAIPAAGVGTAGVVDHAAGVVVGATQNLPGWTGTPIGAVLAERWGRPVHVDNDVNVTALAEVVTNPEQLGRGLVLVLAVGTGVGGALVRDGSLDRGATGTAGELAHLTVDLGRDARVCSCGGRGHLESYTSGPGIVQTYVGSSRQNVDGLEEVVTRAGAGDHAAEEAITAGAGLLGAVVGGLANLLDPHAIVVAGGVLGAGRRYWEAFESALRSTALPGPARVLLRRSTLGPRAGVIGAGLLAAAAERGA